jgi:hypothetical protein
MLVLPTEGRSTTLEREPEVDVGLKASRVAELTELVPEDGTAY